MKSREDDIHICKKMKDALEVYPFHDDNWTVMRHKENKKVFVCIYKHQEAMWINVKCDPKWRDLWRSTFASIIPAYHMNKEHWNSIILDGRCRIKR